jgi:LuxR family maltose regulon positive regulatory protein
VLRPRLLEQIQAGLVASSACKLTLISAPAGFGKTTLVSQWLHDRVASVAWVSLDASDNDLTRFVLYMVRALQTVQENLGTSVVTMLESAQLPSTELAITALINDLASLTKQLVLVLDDYHVIESEMVQQMVAFLVEHLPPQVHLVITSRQEPKLPLPRLRVRQQVNELHASDLRFTAAEAQQFFKQVMRLDLTEADIDALEARTEGWIAGLQMAALSLQGRAENIDSGHHIAENVMGNQHFVFDYLLTEVLSQQPQQVQMFLLQTSILMRLTGSLCEAVCEVNNGQEVLELLERSHLFIVPLDEQRQWYRYHHLFAEMLQVRLRQTRPEHVADLHMRASAWYEQRGFLVEAMDHALAADAFTRAADLLEHLVPTLHKQRQDTTLFTKLTALPEEVVSNKPLLTIERANFAFMTGQLEQAEAHLARTEKLLLQLAADSTHDVTREVVVSNASELRILPVRIALSWATYAQAAGDVQAAAQHARSAFDLLDAMEESEDLEAASWRGGAAGLLGLALWAAGDLETAHQTFQTGMTSIRQAGRVADALDGTLVLADIRVAQGRLHEAMAAYTQTYELTSDGLYGRLRADLHVGMSTVYHAWGQLAEASAQLDAYQGYTSHTQLLENRYRYFVAAANIKQSQGDVEAALELLRHAKQVYIRGIFPNVQPIDAREARCWIQQGKLAQARAWCHQQGLSLDDVLDGDLNYLDEYAHITLVRLELAEYQQHKRVNVLKRIRQFLTQLLATAEQGERIGSVIELLILQTLTECADDNEVRAKSSLKRALDLAESEGYVQMFVDEGEPLQKLITDLADASSYAAMLKQTFDAQMDKPQLSESVQSMPQQQVMSQQLDDKLIDPLTARELEVLQLIAEGLSNEDISKKLFRALSTIKGHNRTMFAKLQVRSRTEAVARARELGLL